MAGDLNETADSFGLGFDVPALGAARQSTAGDLPRFLEQGHHVGVERVGELAAEGAFQGDDAVAVEPTHDRCDIKGIVHAFSSGDSASQPNIRALPCEGEWACELAPCDFSPTMPRRSTRRSWKRSPPPTGSTRPMTATNGAVGSTALSQTCSGPKSALSGYPAA